MVWEKGFQSKWDKRFKKQKKQKTGQNGECRAGLFTRVTLGAKQRAVGLVNLVPWGEVTTQCCHTNSDFVRLVCLTCVGNVSLGWGRFPVPVESRSAATGSVPANWLRAVLWAGARQETMLTAAPSGFANTKCKMCLFPNSTPSPVKHHERSYGGGLSPLGGGEKKNLIV